MSDGVTIILTLDAKPEAVDGLATALAEMIKDTAKRPGFQHIKILRNGNKLTLVEGWDSEAAYDDYIAWRTERGEMEGIGAVVNGMEKSVYPIFVASA